MTREEAIEYLMDMEFNCDASHDKEALHLAIEALGQPTTLYGYNIEALYFVAGLLIERRITQDDLKRLFEDSKWMYAKIREQFNGEVQKAMNSMITIIGKDEVSVKIGGNKDGM